MEKKFGQVLESKYKEFVTALNESGTITDDLGRLFSQNCQADKFLQTCIQFARIGVQSQKSIYCLIRDGHISQAFVLLRWLLELAHLLFFLWKDAKTFKKWSKNSQVKPKDVRKFLRTLGISDWKKIYKDWSNVVHGNFVFIDNYHITWDRTPVTDGQILIVGNAILHLIILSHKLNFVLGQILREQKIEKIKEIIIRFNKLEAKISKLKKIQQENEKEMLK